jgi:hypothetical protein
MPHRALRCKCAHFGVLPPGPPPKSKGRLRDERAGPMPDLVAAGRAIGNNFEPQPLRGVRCEGGRMGNARLNRNRDRRPNRRSRSRLLRAVSAATRTSAAWGAGGLSVILVAALLANALAETSGCARCGGGESSPPVAVAPPPAGFSSVSRLEVPRRHVRLESSGRREARGGADMVCVRTCDGSFFPVT